MIEKVREWLDRANMDLEAGEILSGRIPEYSAYHSQQAVEKYLKAFLVYRGVDFPKSHNIYFILELCKQQDKDFEKLEKMGVQRLTRYAYTRYPGKLEVLKEEAEEALETAKKVREFILKKLGIQ